MYREENIVRGSHFYTFPPRMQIAAKARRAHDSMSTDHQSKAAPGSVSSTTERLHKRHHRRKALMFQPLDSKKGDAVAQTLPPQHTRDDSLPFELRDHIRRLRVILPVISISVMALHRQNAELDHDIATVLSEHACTPLDDEIEHLSSMLAMCATRSRLQEVPA